MGAEILTTSIDISTIPNPQPDNWIIGVDSADGVYKKKNPNGTIINLESANNLTYTTGSILVANNIQLLSPLPPGSETQVLTIVSGVPSWATPVTPPPSGWSLVGNAGTTPGTNFIGTTDPQNLIFKINGGNAGLIDQFSGNTSLGYIAGNIGTSTGSSNVTIGSFSFSSNTTGSSNTTLGFNSLPASLDGNFNVAVGANAMQTSTSGSNNTGVGCNALLLADGGVSNTAIGYNSLSQITVGGDNTALGYNSGLGLTTGTGNTIIGNAANVNNGNSLNRTVIGFQAISNSDNSVVLGNSSVTTTVVNGSLYMLDTVTATWWKGSLVSGVLTWTNTGSGVQP